MPTTDWTYAGTAVNSGGTGNEWLNPSRAAGAANASASTNQVGVDYPEIDKLVPTQYGFALPATARVLGYEIRPLFLSVTDGGDARLFVVPRTAAAFGTADYEVLAGDGGNAEPVFGGPTTNYGLALRGAQVNASDFGARIYAQQHTYEWLPLSIDAVAIRLTWAAGGGCRSRERAFGRGR